MLSPTFLSPGIGVNFSQPPSVFAIQTSKSTSQIKSSDSKNHKRQRNATNCRCFSCGNPYSIYDFQSIRNVPTSLENPDAEFSENESFIQSLRPYLIAFWLQSCRSPKDVRRIHSVVIKWLINPVTYVYNNLICAYLRFGKLSEARNVFDKMTVRNVVTWSALINGYLSLGFEDEALSLFADSIKNGVQANGKMFVCILNLCSRMLELELGRQIHACVVKGSWRNLIVSSAIAKFYADCGDLSSAFREFDQIPNWDVVCWTTMITACSQQGHGQKAFSLFSQMLSNGYSPNEFTVCGVLKACGEEKELKFGRQLHGSIVKKMYKNDVFIGTSLVDMYAKCGEILDARKVFNGMRNRNTVTWTSIIAGYAREGLGQEAINLFRVMKGRNIFANNLTIVSILRACGTIRDSLMGREVHAQIIKNSIETSLYLGSTLVWFYCRCGESSNATKVLEQMPLRDVVSWTAIISGCAHLGHESEALEFLKKMTDEGVEPNSFTYSSALKACAKLEAVLHGKLIHSSANKTLALSNVYVGSALINMYAKCGYVAEAIQVFDNMPERNLVSWKAMIVGYAKNGLCQEALRLMYRMQAEGFEVDDYILATVLTACGGVEWDVDSSSQFILQST
ncbi:pentatricopeptide repeat-containing protein At4g18520, chloroplastic-like [Ziziphus jujuba]|uniref:Pentatricopeptide repeat-containing protein At4g18520, chloroplastic-like n=1 Tax=Ziziphus jujuba TaxID=326968 RepID=A0A6P6GB84_ZIZJJ|nr:pentatricopeptide repeat-containing protein At4g18520, chloroplastic-like [Ziziphus jujuba]